MDGRTKIILSQIMKSELVCLTTEIEYGRRVFLIAQNELGQGIGRIIYPVMVRLMSNWSHPDPGGDVGVTFSNKTPRIFELKDPFFNMSQGYSTAGVGSCLR